MIDRTLKSRIVAFVFGAASPMEHENVGTKSGLSSHAGPLVLGLVLLALFGISATRAQAVNERAIVVVGEDDPFAFVGYPELAWEIGSEDWAIFDTLAQWLVQRRGAPQNASGGRKQRILLVGAYDDFELPVVDAQAYSMQLYLHLKHREHAVDTVSWYDLPSLEASRLRSYDLIISTGPVNSTLPLDGIRESGAALLVHSARVAAELGLILPGSDVGRGPTAIVPDGDGPFARLGVRELSPGLQSAVYHVRRVGPRGRAALVPPPAALHAGGLEPLGDVAQDAPPSRPDAADTVAAIDGGGDAAFVIAHDEKPWVFFGFSYAWHWQSDAWCYLDAVVDWLAGEGRAFRCHGQGHDREIRNDNKRILFFGYSPDYVLPIPDHQLSSFVATTHLTFAGYDVELRSQTELPRTSVEELREFDVVIYWNIYGYHLATVVDSGVPFVTTSLTHARTLGIVDAGGSGHVYQEHMCVRDDTGPYAAFRQGEESLEPSPYYSPSGVLARPTASSHGLILATCSGSDEGSVSGSQDPGRSDPARAAFAGSAAPPEAEPSQPSSQASFGILAVAPNPTMGDGRLEFEIPSTGHVRLAVFDVRGRLVLDLEDGRQQGGRHATNLSLRGPTGALLPSGIYFVRLEFSGRSQTRKVMLLR